MARRGLSDETCDRVKQALLALNPKTPDDKAMLDGLYGVQGFVEARMPDFAEVARIAARYGFIRKPEAFVESVDSAVKPGNDGDTE